MFFVHVTNIFLVYTCISKCSAQESSIQGSEKGYPPEERALDRKTPQDGSEYPEVQKCDSLMDNGVSLMCNGADWWKRDLWNANRVENQHPSDSSVFSLNEQTENWASLHAGLLETDRNDYYDNFTGKWTNVTTPFGSGKCTEKPGFYYKIKGTRNSARWFKGKYNNMDCAAVCADANMDNLHVNGEILAFDPVSMVHGGPRYYDYIGNTANTYSHAVADTMLPLLATSHTYMSNNNEYPASHQHLECVEENTVLKKANGGSGHGPFVYTASGGCTTATDFGVAKDDTVYGSANQGFYREPHYGCMDWYGNRKGQLSLYSCSSMCTCRDSYVEDETGQYMPLDVHTNSTHGERHRVLANTFRRNSYENVLEWHFQMLENGGYGMDNPLYGDADIDTFNAGNPPPNYPKFEEIVKGSPAPELQLGYHCTCPHGTHGKNCELKSTPCDAEHEPGKGTLFSKCVLANTKECVHDTTRSLAGERQCICEDGWMGSTCALKDKCHVRWGHKCVHGTCEYAPELTRVVRAPGDPFFNYLTTCASETEDSLNGTDHDHGDGEEDCTAFGENDGCISEPDIGFKHCCETCKDIQRNAGKLWQLGYDEPDAEKECVDKQLSGNCADKAKADECEQNHAFMYDKCCATCTEKDANFGKDATAPDFGGYGYNEGGFVDVLVKDGFVCNCYDGWQGSECDVIMNACDADPCSDDGTLKHLINSGADVKEQCSIASPTCVNDCTQMTDKKLAMRGDESLFAYSYVCNCKKGFSGKNCGVEIGLKTAISDMKHFLSKQAANDEAAAIDDRSEKSMRLALMMFFLTVTILCVGACIYFNNLPERRKEEEPKIKANEVHGNKRRTISGMSLRRHP